MSTTTPETMTSDGKRRAFRSLYIPAARIVDRCSQDAVRIRATPGRVRQRAFLRLACSSVGLRASLMKCVALISWLLFCAGMGNSLSSDLKPRIALDIGHSIQRPGAYSARGVSEYYFNKTVAEALLRSLKKSGVVDAFIINPQGRSISLMERTREAANKQATLFLSIHHDSVQRRYMKNWSVAGKTHLYSDNFSGFSVFVSRKNRKFPQSLKFANLLGESMNARGFAPTLHHAEKIPGEGRNLINKELGLYEYDDLVVLKTAAMPAVLLECGVIVNRSEEVSLQKPEIQQRIVNAASEAILAFVRVNQGIAEGESRKSTQP
jgi:N-acetylmuramoyl-L-alanine amidase